MSAFIRKMVLNGYMIIPECCLCIQELAIT